MGGLRLWNAILDFGQPLVLGLYKWSLLES